MKYLKPLILAIFITILISTFIGYKYFSMTKSSEKYFAVIPHHSLINPEIDEFYKNLSKKYKQVKNIVIISPDHFGKNKDYFEGFKENGKYCFGTEKNCINGKKFDFYNVFPSPVGEGVGVRLNEHGIGNHFAFINKYFNAKNIYGLTLKINREENKNLDDLYEKLINYDFKSGNTLFIASVDFSHHVNEKIAVFHDLNTYQVLNSKENKNIEVDCPNCLFLEKKLANFYKKQYFNVVKRTSSDNFTSTNTNYNNTSYTFGEFESIKSEDNLSKFDSFLNNTTFKNLETGSGNQNYVTAIFFGDTQFTRGFTYYKKPQEFYLKCLYQNKDQNKKPEYWHNRMLYSFDIAGVNLETALTTKDKCQDSNKSIKLSTDPKYMDLFKKLGFNTYNISNNHVYDCGNIGFQATKENLNQYGLNYFGDGRGNESNILKKEINGTKIAFVGLNDVDLKWNKEDKVSEVTELKKEGYLVVLNMHWGLEYKTVHNKKQEELAHYFIDNGVNLIIGHHPHVVQDYEVYKGVPIFYSLGNFIFDQPFPETLLGYGIVFAINKNGVKYNLIEFKRNSKNWSVDCDSFK